MFASSPSLQRDGIAHRPSRTQSAQSRPHGTQPLYTSARSRPARSNISESTLQPAFAATLPALRGPPSVARHPAPPFEQRGPARRLPATEPVGVRKVGRAAHAPRSTRAGPATTTNSLKGHAHLPPLQQPLKVRSSVVHGADAVSEEMPSPAVYGAADGWSESPPCAEASRAATAQAVDSVPCRVPSPPPETPAAPLPVSTTAGGHLPLAAPAMSPPPPPPPRPSHPVLARLAITLATLAAGPTGLPEDEMEDEVSAALPSGDVVSEAYTLVANAEAVRCSVMAMPLGDVYAYYHEALRYVGAPAAVGGGDHGQCRGNNDVPVLKDARLRRVLGGLVRSNIAVEQRQSFSCHPRETQLSLLLALEDVDGVLATLILYNLAALFFSEGQVEDATEAIARCVELAQACLAVPPPPAPADPAAHTTWKQRRAQAVYRSFISFHATHLVLSHLLIASFATWCGEEARVAQYHCQLAAGCATTYLPVSHSLRHRCLKRLKAAQSRVSHTTGGAAGARAEAEVEALPPSQPLLFFGELLPVFDPGEEAPRTAVADDSTAAGEMPHAMWWRWCTHRGASLDEDLDAGATAQCAADWLARPVAVSELLALSEQASRSPGLATYVADARNAVQHGSDEAFAAEQNGEDGEPSLRATLRHFGERLAEAHGGDHEVAHANSGAATAQASVPQPPVITALPAHVFRRYRKLKASTASAMDAEATAPTGSADARSRHQMDRELLRFSVVVPHDESAEASLSPRERAARRIQRGFRCHRARCRAEARANAAKDERERQMNTAEVASRDSESPAEGPTLDDPREAAVRVLQRWVRRHAAQERRRQARERQETLDWLRHRGAARCLARRRHAQLRRRAQAQQWAPHATRLQRWWRSQRVQQQRLLSTRQADVRAYLAAEEADFADRMGAIRWDAARAAHTVLAVLRGARDRAALAVQRTRLQRAKAVLLRAVWRYRARKLLESHTMDQLERWQTQRVAEMRTDAATVIQSAVRPWLARRRERRRPSPEQAAQRIQRLWRHHHHQTCLAQRYREQQERQLAQYAATLIQATWRMYITRRRVAAQLQFLLWDRHVFAQRIQRAWRAWCARQTVWRECAYVAHREAQRQAEERRYVAAARVQATVRMFLARQRLRASGHAPLWPVQLRAGSGNSPRPAGVVVPPTGSESDEEESWESSETYSDNDDDEELVSTGSRSGSTGGDSCTTATTTYSAHSGASATTAPPPPRSRSPTETLGADGSKQSVSGPSPLSLHDADDDGVSTDSSSPQLAAYVARGSGAEGPSPEQVQAAIIIQKYWRGFSVRSRYEFYYELFYEEVEVTDDDDGDEGGTEEFTDAEEEEDEADEAGMDHRP